MEPKLIKVGNSKGVIIPAKILQLVDLEERLQITVEENRIILAPVKERPRQGWEEAIVAEIEKNGQPENLLPQDLDDTENEEWTW